MGILRRQGGNDGGGRGGLPGIPVFPGGPGAGGLPGMPGLPGGSGGGSGGGRPGVPGMPIGPGGVDGGGDFPYPGILPSPGGPAGGGKLPVNGIIPLPGGPGLGGYGAENGPIFPHTCPTWAGTGPAEAPFPRTSPYTDTFGGTIAGAFLVLTVATESTANGTPVLGMNTGWTLASSASYSITSPKGAHPVTTYTVYIYYWAAAPSQTSITFTFTDISDLCYNITEFNQGSLAGTVDSTATANGTGTTQDTGTTATSSTSCDLAIAVWGSQVNTLVSGPTNSFISLGTTSFYNIAYLIPGAAQTFESQVVVGTSTEWCGTIVCFN